MNDARDVHLRPPREPVESLGYRTVVRHESCVDADGPLGHLAALGLHFSGQSCPKSGYLKRGDQLAVAARQPLYPKRVFMGQLCCSWHSLFSALLKASSRQGCNLSNHRRLSFSRRRVRETRSITCSLACNSTRTAAGRTPETAARTGEVTARLHSRPRLPLHRMGEPGYRCQAAVELTVPEPRPPAVEHRHEDRAARLLARLHPGSLHRRGMAPPVRCQNARQELELPSRSVAGGGTERLFLPFLARAGTNRRGPGRSNCRARGRQRRALWVRRRVHDRGTRAVQPRLWNGIERDCAPCLGLGNDRQIDRQRGLARSALLR